MIDLHARLPFFLATDPLKELQRANWIHGRERLETVAEHSWHVTLLAMLFEDCAPPGTDHDHVRDLLIIHDLVEVHAGDTNVWNDELRQSQAEREMAAGERLTQLLPVDDAPRFDALWREYQAQESEEARFARAIDSLHPVLMQWAEGGFGHSNTAITPSGLLQRKQSLIEPYPELWALLNHVVWQAARCGRLSAEEDDPVRRAGTSPSVLTPRLDFFLATDRLKEELRGNLILSQPRCESVAEHCWHVSLLGMLLSDCAPEGVDLDRVADLLIVHDLVEVYAGDTDIVDLAGQETMAEREAQAAVQLLRLLPPEPRLRFEELIDEFQAQETEEARFARAIDTLHPTMLTWVDGAHVHPDHENAPASASVVVERKRKMLEPYPLLWALLTDIAQGAVDRGVVSPDDAFPRSEDANPQ